MKTHIPTLQAVLDPHELGKHLHRVLPAQWGLVRHIQLRVLQHHHTSRCVVDITLQTTTGSYELVGKVYAEDRPDVYRAMKHISQSGFGPSEEFSIPQPFAFIPELNLLLQEKIQGPMVREIFLKGGERERAVAAERCACWLAYFHARATISGPVFIIGQELLEYWFRRLAKKAGPQSDELMSKAASLCERLENASVKLNRDNRCACHGDYCHYQIVLTENRVATLDWDGFCVAHPGLDLARFIVVLRQLALQSQGSLNALDADVEVFYKTYTAKSTLDAAEHLPFYKAAHYLRHAKDHLNPGNGGLEMAAIMLDEGLRIMGGEISNGKRLSSAAFKRTLRPHALQYSWSHRPKMGRTLVDARLPTLQTVLNLGDLRRYLNPILPSDWGLLRDIQINRLKPVHGRRRMVDIVLQTTTGNYKLIGKDYGRDRSDVYRAIKQISQSGFGPAEEFSIPQPFAFIPQLNLLLQEKVEGSLVTEIILAGDERERARAAERCARWLVHFQTHGPVSGPAFVLRPMEHWTNRFRKAAGALQDKLGLLFRRLELAAFDLDGARKCACHGNYSHDQISLTETRAATSSWNGYRVGDPAWDVAWFIMSLQMLALESLDSITALDSTTEVFYQTYTNRSKFEISQQLPFFKAAYCLKRAGHFLKRGSNEKTEVMLDEGLRILAEE